MSDIYFQALPCVWDSNPYLYCELNQRPPDWFSLIYTIVLECTMIWPSNPAGGIGDYSEHQQSSLTKIILGALPDKIMWHAWYHPYKNWPLLIADFVASLVIPRNIYPSVNATFLPFQGSNYCVSKYYLPLFYVLVCLIVSSYIHCCTIPENRSLF